MLRKPIAKEVQGSNKLAENLTQGCAKALSSLLPFTQNENMFLEKLLEQGEIRPELICDDNRFNENLIIHPSILRKAKKYENFI